jgi:CheY-like chemotaxis protein
MGKFLIEEVYLIDDDAIVRLVASKILKSIDFNDTITSFENGQLALDGIKEKIGSGSIPFKDRRILVLLDINMPILDAWGFLDEFAKLSDEIKEHFLITIITSSIDSNDKTRAFSYPEVLDYITKPLSGKHLTDFLSAHHLYEE